MDPKPFLLFFKINKDELDENQRHGSNNDEIFINPMEAAINDGFDNLVPDSMRKNSSSKFPEYLAKSFDTMDVDGSKKLSIQEQCTFMASKGKFEMGSATNSQFVQTSVFKIKTFQF